ncbi:alpha/beta fold hydrolase [Saccharomonospora sp. NPDC046836]|uniref:alpha/beta fold hydrolase n=1 Tax=Saccharomonospora sp. NPDC046836 TaxID=3156921 RepID=UPI0033EEA600
MAAIPAAFGVASAFYQRCAERKDNLRFSAPGEFVDIGNRRLHVIRSGSGRPVVVVLPALSTPAVEWVRVQRALTSLTDSTVLVVDRAGIGWSDPAPWPRTLSTMADEVHQLLAGLGLKEPVILVGHSVGGLIARLYAARHRERVAQLILVDSSHEDQNKHLHRFDRTVGDGELWRGALRYRLRLLGWYRWRKQFFRGDELVRVAAREVPADLVDAHIARDFTTSRRRAVVQEFGPDGVPVEDAGSCPRGRGGGAVPRRGRGRPSRTTRPLLGYGAIATSSIAAGPRLLRTCA